MTDIPVGCNVVREDALEKVCGRAQYVGDIRLPGMLYGKVLRSTVPHARIVAVNADKARALPGVKAVITGADLGGVRTGLKIKDQPVLADERVRFVGERIAAVAAVDAGTALEALKRIRVEYEEMPTVLDPVAAMSSGAVLLHPEQETYEGRMNDAAGNIASRVTFQKGDLREGWKLADRVFRQVYTTPVVHQGYLETHCCIVDVNPTGEVLVWSTNKAPYRLQRELALLLGLPFHQVKVAVSPIGGDFGGKGSLMDVPIAFHLSRLTGRPVMIDMTREEEFIAGAPRHASVITILSGVDRFGNLVAWQAEVVFNSGAYASLKPSGSLGGVARAAGPYRIPHVRIDGYCVYTNTVPCGHCRAPGDPQVTFAVESHMDLMARELGIDPVEFRLQNAVDEGDLSPTGQEWRDVRCRAVVREAARVSGWKARQRDKGRGWGCALTERPIGRGVSSAVVRLWPDGTVVVVTGVADPGTGSRTVLRQIAAAVLMVPVSTVRVETGDTSSAPFDTGSGSSRVTHVAGQAVRLACLDLKRQVAERLADHWRVPAAGITFRPGGHVDWGTGSCTWQEMAATVGVVMGKAVYAASRPSQTCFAVHIAEVDVDTETGQVRVLRFFAVHDIGRALNPAMVEGQIEGAVAQGLGYALFEQSRWPGGYPVDTSFAEYRLPLADDVPVIVPVLVEGGTSPGPYHAKSIGEIPITPVAPAITNAIFDATGVRITDLPATPEKIAAALAASKAGESAPGWQGV